MNFEMWVEKDNRRPELKWEDSVVKRRWKGKEKKDEEWDGDKKQWKIDVTNKTK